MATFITFIKNNGYNYKCTLYYTLRDTDSG